MSSALLMRDFEYAYPDCAGPTLRVDRLEVAEGEFVVLAGASGSGKSTLLRAVTGLVPHFHGGRASGFAEVCGHDLRETRPAELAAYCGSLAQDPESQTVMSRVWDEIALPLENAGMRPAEVGRGVEEIALALGIADLLDRQTSELSGGELQRVGLAAALAPRPRVVVLDEPTSQLDPVAGDELIHTLRRLNEEWGVTVLLAEQRLERCLHAADRTLVLEHGALEFSGTAGEFIAWAAATGRQELLPPSALAFQLAGAGPLPFGVKQARRTLTAAGLGALTTGARAATPSRARTRRQAGRDSRPLARVRSVWREHAGAVALRGISLEINRGERVALMGRNGAGKSTLLRLLKRLDRPSRGSIELDGDVGLLLQNPNDYLVHETAAGELTATEPARRLEVLQAYGVAHAAQSDPRDLSGGERQRLALAVVMQASPDLLLLDEPTRGMDHAHRGKLIEMFGRLDPHGQSLVVATHDPEFAARFADRVVLLGRGELIADGTPQEVFGGGWHFTTELARVLPGAGVLTPEEGAAAIKTALFEHSRKRERA